MDVRGDSFKAFFLTMFVTTCGAAFFCALLFGVVMRARACRASREAALVTQSQGAPAAELSKLKVCKAIVVEMPCGHVCVGDPGSDTEDPCPASP